MLFTSNNFGTPISTVWKVFYGRLFIKARCVWLAGDRDNTNLPHVCVREREWADGTMCVFVLIEAIFCCFSSFRYTIKWKQQMSDWCSCKLLCKNFVYNIVEVNIIKLLQSSFAETYHFLNFLKIKFSSVMEICYRKSCLILALFIFCIKDVIKFKRRKFQI